MKLLFFILVVLVAGWIGYSFYKSLQKGDAVKGGGGTIKLPGSEKPDTSKEDDIDLKKPL